MKKYRFLTAPYKRNLGARAASVSALCLVSAAHAFDSTWLLQPSTNNWNDYNNWSTPVSPFHAPVAPGDNAIFTQSNQLSPTIPSSSLVQIDSITFNPGASEFTIQNGGCLFLQGVGIVNNSGVAQTINNSSFLFFIVNSSAGNATINNSAILGFAENSSAGNATINNSSNLQFVQNSSAGNATINNSLNLDFFGNSSGGNATINNLIGVESTGQTIFHRHVNCRERDDQQRRRRNFHAIRRAIDALRSRWRSRADGTAANATITIAEAIRSPLLIGNSEGTRRSSMRTRQLLSPSRNWTPRAPRWVRSQGMERSIWAQRTLPSAAISRAQFSPG